MLSRFDPIPIALSRFSSIVVILSGAKNRTVNFANFDGVPQICEHDIEGA